MKVRRIDERDEVYLALCRRLKDQYVWRSDKNSNGFTEDGLFLLGINCFPGRQISFWLPMSRWFDCGFAATLTKAPPYDGHSPADVIERLQSL